MLWYGAVCGTQTHVTLASAPVQCLRRQVGASKAWIGSRVFCHSERESAASSAVRIVKTCRLHVRCYKTLKRCPDKSNGSLMATEPLSTQLSQCERCCSFFCLPACYGPYSVRISVRIFFSSPEYLSLKHRLRCLHRCLFFFF